MLEQENMKYAYLKAKLFCEKHYQGMSASSDSRQHVVARFPDRHREYTEVMKIDEKNQLLVMELYPGITVRPEHLAATQAYIGKVNALNAAATIQVNDLFGTIYAKYTRYIGTEVVTDNILLFMDNAIKQTIYPFVDVLDKLAHGILLDPNEADPEAIVLLYGKKRLDKFLDFRYQEEDDDEEDDDDDDIEFPFLEDDDDMLPFRGRDIDDSIKRSVDEMIDNFNKRHKRGVLDQFLKDDDEEKEEKVEMNKEEKSSTQDEDELFWLSVKRAMEELEDEMDDNKSDD